MELLSVPEMNRGGKELTSYVLEANVPGASQARIVPRQLETGLCFLFVRLNDRLTCPRTKLPGNSSVSKSKYLPWLLLTETANAVVWST